MVLVLDLLARAKPRGFQATSNLATKIHLPDALTGM